MNVADASILHTGGAVSPDPFDMSLLGDSLENKQQPQKKTPHSFLGENSALVNLDNLVTVSKPPSVAPSPGKPASCHLKGLTNDLFPKAFPSKICTYYLSCLSSELRTAIASAPLLDLILN